MNESSKPVARLLGKEGDLTLKKLITRAAQLERLDKKFAQLLGEPLNQHVKLANIDAGVAHILADSSPWLSRLRYIQPQLVNMFAELGVPVTKVQTRINPPQTGFQPPPTRAKDIPDEARDLLKSLAEQQKDPALKKSLLRLSNAQKRGTGKPE